MSLIATELILIIVIIVFVFASSKTENEDTQNKSKRSNNANTAKARKPVKREDTTCTFSDGYSESDFDALAHSIAGKTRRIIYVNVYNAVVRCTVKSQSGFTTWDFYVDFNDWGHLSGNYWIKSENDDSPIPKWFAEEMTVEILRHKQYT